MADLEIKRSFSAPRARVFRALTQADQVLQWWGPEGFTCASDQIGFDRPGPYRAVMTSPEGTRHKVSGQVTHVSPDTSIGFTWAWHDDADQRGAESHVTITLEDAPGGGTTLTLAHRDLATEDAAAAHRDGWTSTLKKLDALLAA